VRTIVLGLVVCIASGCAPLVERLGEGAPGGRWSVEVSVQSPGLGPIHVSVGRLRPAPVNDAEPWLQHELIFENRSDRPVRFGDTRTSAFLGSSRQHVLLAADDGCGYVRKTPSALVEPGACLTYLDAFVVESHASVRRTITLFKELPGMDELTAGTYVFKRPVLFDYGRAQPDGSGTHALLKLVYEIS
jgi:hypothetical protein